MFSDKIPIIKVNNDDLFKVMQMKKPNKQTKNTHNTSNASKQNGTVYFAWLKGFVYIAYYTDNLLV